MDHGTRRNDRMNPSDAALELDGQNPSTYSLLDIEFWRRVYDELLKFVDELASVQTLSIESRQHLDALKAELAARARFWKNQLDALDRPPDST